MHIIYLFINSEIQRSILYSVRILNFIHHTSTARPQNRVNGKSEVVVNV